LTLDAEQQELQRTVRRFLEKHSPESAVRRASAEAGCDRQLWHAIGDQGLAGLAVPERLGGSGFSYAELAVVAEELGRALACVPFFASVALAAELLRHIGDGSAESNLVPRIVSGESIATVAFLDDAHTWQAQEPGVIARRADAGWVLNGAKRYVVAGDVADVLLVVASEDGKTSVFAVDTSSPGIARTRLDSLDQTRPLADVAFDATPARLIGEYGESAAAVEGMLVTAGVLLAAEQVGGAGRVLDMAVEYAKTRIQFGRPIGAFQAIKHKCANMLAELEGGRAAARYATWTLQTQDDDLVVASALAQAKCSEVYVSLAAENVQVHGGIGFTWEHPAHLYVKRSRADYVLLGTPVEYRRRLAELLAL
jgi:alkylation response protein AidB-like acyl-CoA dehydrogenase